MKIIRWLDRHIEETLLVIFSSIMVSVIFIQVIARLLDNSLSWSEELARYCFIWMVYIGISYGVKKQRHIKVDVVLVLLKEKGRLILTIIANILFIVFALFIIRYGFDIANKLLGFGQKSPALQIPMGLVYMATPIGIGLTLIRLIQNLIKYIKALLGKGEVEERTEAERIQEDVLE
ncbi:TRAP transporter small permease [Litchfieldia salsa]|uniref:TRAP-type C4-dicarboxylate transport system, small permease component n=1 Tax=Litchfieldia salsa TaxID=930152 RepID=A0A1H0VQR4_9BACI|nr:TRAP transporter small permease [Litchfieldia salsa]SDP80694.1 TRAP-type C4-dicarboxylate transport system, small permease component [Litchfieldia salsa]